MSCSPQVGQLHFSRSRDFPVRFYSTWNTPRNLYLLFLQVHHPRVRPSPSEATGANRRSVRNCPLSKLMAYMFKYAYISPIDLAIVSHSGMSANRWRLSRTRTTPSWTATAQEREGKEPFTTPRLRVSRNRWCNTHTRSRKKAS